MQGLSPVFVLSLERSWAVCRNTHNEGFSDSVGYLHCCFLQNHHWGAEFGNPRTRKVGVKQEACDSSCLPQQHFHCQFSDTKMNATCGHIMVFFWFKILMTNFICYCNWIFIYLRFLISWLLNWFFLIKHFQMMNSWGFIFYPEITVN